MSLLRYPCPTSFVSSFPSQIYAPPPTFRSYNWSSVYKSFVAFQMGALTFSVYIGSSIYSAGITGPNPDSVTKHFNVSDTTALVGLTVFIAGYGIGPMLWAPLTEFPQIGRLPVCEFSHLVTLRGTAG